MWRRVWLVVAPGLVGCEIFDGPFGGGPTQIAANNIQVQVFEGTVNVDALTSPSPEDALVAFQDGQLETVAQIFARPPIDAGGGGPDVIAAPDVETGFLERWVYRDAEVDAALNVSGFLMRHDGGHPATCDEIEITVGALRWNDPVFSEQVLEYVEPPDSADDALEGSIEAVTFTVYQPNDQDEIVPRGSMFRALPPNARTTTQQDHWLLSADYEPLGDGGTYAIVIPEGPVETDSLGEWFADRSPEAGSYAVTAYPRSAFPEGCFDGS